MEFLYDVDAQKVYFIEVNPRIQVEHTVTEMVTGIDLVPLADPGRAGTRAARAPLSLPAQEDVPLYGAALQCRVTTEDPEKQFRPRLRQNYHVPLSRGIRHPPGRRHGVCRRRLSRRITTRCW